MPRNISLAKVVEACIDGFEEANRNYIDWTGGWSARTAPEFLSQVEIAKALAKVCPAISLEDKTQDIILNAQGETRGKPPRNILGRVDITVWHASSEPRFAIEIKKANTPGKIKNDIRRLGQLVDRCAKLQAGIMIVITGSVNEGTLDSRFSAMEKELRLKLSKKSEYIQATNKRDKSIYVGAAVFIVKSKHR